MFLSLPGFDALPSAKTFYLVTRMTRNGELLVQFDMFQHLSWSLPEISNGRESV